MTLANNINLFSRNREIEIKVRNLSNDENILLENEDKNHKNTVDAFRKLRSLANTTTFSFCFVEHFELR